MANNTYQGVILCVHYPFLTSQQNKIQRMGNIGKTVVSACKSVYNNVIKPAVKTVYKCVIKPVLKAVEEVVIKPLSKVAKFTVKAISTTCGYIAEAINWVDKNITFGLIGSIGKNTLGRVYQSGNWVYNQFCPPKTHKDIHLKDVDDIMLLSLQIRAVWLGDTTWSNVSKVLSPITAIGNGMLPKHRWLVAMGRDKGCAFLNDSHCSNHPNIWFHFGFGQQKVYRGAIRYSKHGSYRQADQQGRCYSAGNFHDSASTVKNKSIKTLMKNAVYFAQGFDPRYDLAQNNCQTFAQELYDYL